MPTGRHDSLQKLYDRQKLLSEEAARFESQRDSYDPDSDRYYLLELQITALREETSRLSSLTGDILERDLQR